MLRLLFSTGSVRSSRFGLVGVPAWAAWLHWIIQLSYDALRPCHSGPRRTCWLGMLHGASCPSVSELINGKTICFYDFFSPPNWPSLRQGSNLGHTCSIKIIQGSMLICFGFRACIWENMGGHSYYHGLKIYTEIPGKGVLCEG